MNPTLHLHSAWPRRWVAAAAALALSAVAPVSQALPVFSDLVVYPTLQVFAPTPMGELVAGIWHGNFVQPGHFNFLHADHSPHALIVQVGDGLPPPPDPVNTAWGGFVRVTADPASDLPLRTFLLDANGLGHFSYDLEMFGLVESTMVTLPVRMTMDFLPPAQGSVVGEIAISLQRIPEPGTLALMALAGMALLWSRRRSAESVVP